MDTNQLPSPAPTLLDVTPAEVEIATDAYLEASNRGLPSEEAIRIGIDAINRSRDSREASIAEISRRVGLLIGTITLLDDLHDPCDECATSDSAECESRQAINNVKPYL